MTPDEKATWDEAVAVYDREFASKDLLFDRGMTMIKLGLSDRDDALTDAPFDDELKLLLISAAPIYRKYWWPAHDAANRVWIEDAVRRTRTYAPAIIGRLTALYGVPWFRTTVRVDVVRVGKSQGAYTSNDPTHIVVASADDSYAEPWSSVEILFHESSHALIQKVSAAVNGALAASKKRPSDLWHVVFFISLAKSPDNSSPTTAFNTSRISMRQDSSRGLGRSSACRSSGTSKRMSTAGQRLRTWRQILPERP